MQKIENLTTRTKGIIAFVDFKPAELKKNSRWEVVYYAKHPVKQEFERFRVSVPPNKSFTERNKFGKTIVLEINKKLESGWLPYYSQTSSKEFKTFEYCKNLFLEQTTTEVASGLKRIDTIRTYTSNLKMITKYCIDNKIKLNLMFDFNNSFVVNYLDWIYYERKNSERTYNNHLRFIGTFINFCINHGWLKENFSATIKKKREGQKKREILTEIEKQKLKEFCACNPEYFTACMLTYFCFIRRTELTKLKVSDVNLDCNYITIDEKISKNHKTENVTIPHEYKNLIEKHIATAKKNDYIFSKDFKAGSESIEPKKVSDVWQKFRKEKNVDSKYQFYSLKDTGITDLLNSGIAAIKVRDQARHHDLRITESYTSRNKTCDDFVRISKFNF